MEETQLTTIERQEIANAYFARVEAEANERQQGRDYDVFYACLSGSYRAAIFHLINESPEAAALIKKAFIKK